MNLRPALAVLFAACLCAPLVLANESGSPFTDDLAAAKARAKESHKDILVGFTGSDWCHWCNVLDKEVFFTPKFKAKAPEHFELVQLDFPHDTPKQSPEVKARNAAWRKEILPDGYGFPDVALLDETGRIYAKTGYREGGPEAYLKHIEELRSRRIKRDEALTLAAKADGLEKAKHLDAALSALRSRKMVLTHYNATVKEILALDTKDKAGLKTKYATLLKTEQCIREIDGFYTTKDQNAMLAKFKAYAARKDVPAEARQFALYSAANSFSKLSTSEKVALAKQAIAEAPESPLVEESIQPYIDHLSKKKN